MAFVRSQVSRIKKLPRELFLFGLVIFAMGVGSNIVDSTFNNFLDEVYQVTPFQRSFLEFPRELPGFLVVFVSAGLSFLCSRRLGAVTMLLASLGILLVGFAAPTYTMMTLWLFTYSLGQHLFMPLSSSIGMELATKNQTGKRLGQLNAVRNTAMIIGSFLVVLGFQNFGFQFKQIRGTVSPVIPSGAQQIVKS